MYGYPLARFIRWSAATTNYNAFQQTFDKRNPKFVWNSRSSQRTWQFHSNHELWIHAEVPGGKLRSTLRANFALFCDVLLLYFPVLAELVEHTRTETNWNVRTNRKVLSKTSASLSGVFERISWPDRDVPSIVFRSALFPRVCSGDSSFRKTNWYIRKLLHRTVRSVPLPKT